MTHTLSLASKKKIKRQLALMLQKEHTQEFENGYKVRPANTLGIESEGNYFIGWELIPPNKDQPEWYFMAKETAIQAIPRHQAKYS